MPRQPSEATALRGLQDEVLLLRNRLSELERSAPVVVPVETLAPEPVEVRKLFHVVVRPQDDGFVASFFDANLSASGDTQEEAVRNLKDIVAAAFEVLTEHDPKTLGPGPAKQLHVLKQFLRRKP
jgi:predicted RNase H-like HicB family nuclease